MFRCGMYDTVFSFLVPSYFCIPLPDRPYSMVSKASPGLRGSGGIICYKQMLRRDACAHTVVASTSCSANTLVKKERRGSHLGSPVPIADVSNVIPGTGKLEDKDVETHLILIEQTRSFMSLAT